MQLIYLFFSSQQIKFWAPDLSPSEGQLLHSGGMAGVLEALPQFLDSIPIFSGSLVSGESKAVAIFDQGLCSYRHFKFPPLKAAKVKKILPFELEDELISPVEGTIYDVKIKKFQAAKPAEAGVYLLEKEALHHVKSLTKNAGLELVQATSSLGLLDQIISSNPNGEEGLHLYLDGDQAFLLLYQGGFLVQSSKIEPQATATQLLKAVNQRLKACLLELGESTALSLGGQAKNLAEVTEKKEVVFKDSVGKGGKAKPEIPFLFPEQYKIPLQTGATINFTKREAKGLKDFGNAFWKFKEVAILLGLWLGIYLGAVGYQLYKQGKELTKIEKVHKAVAARYVPGIPASRVLQVLKKRLGEQITARGSAKSFWAGDYPISSLLLRVSESFKEVKGFKMTHFTLNQQGLILKGVVPDLKALDQVKTLAEKLFPKANYSLRFSQKPGPEGSSVFNLSVERVG
ncbi:MAG: hypothetical protein QNL04_01920 [SAR324 cluster bacterium]|nr:hypothetical protein [SAR324 cluster bacterium]